MTRIFLTLVLVLTLAVPAFADPSVDVDSWEFARFDFLLDRVGIDERVKACKGPQWPDPDLLRGHWYIVSLANDLTDLEEGEEEYRPGLRQQFADDISKAKCDVLGEDITLYMEYLDKYYAEASEKLRAIRQRLVEQGLIRAR